MRHLHKLYTQFLNSVVTFFKLYGRSKGISSGRLDYVTGSIVSGAGLAFFYLINVAIGKIGSHSGKVVVLATVALLALASILAFVIFLVPLFNLTARRLHDLALPGWPFSILFIITTHYAHLTGALLLYFFFLSLIPGRGGVNKYVDRVEAGSVGGPYSLTSFNIGKAARAAIIGVVVAIAALSGLFLLLYLALRSFQ